MQRHCHVLKALLYGSVSSSAHRAEAIVFLGSADLAGVVEEEGVVGGHASKPWPLASMPSW